MRAANGIAVSLYRRSNGRIGGKAKGIPVLLLTVAGRRTGTPFTVPVVYFEHEGDDVGCGTAGGLKVDPQWVSNLKAAGQATVQIGTQTYAADGRVTDGASASSCGRPWCLLAPSPWRTTEEKSGRVIPVARLTPRAR